ncbi:MAG: aldehyde dehydrogenase family protein, partial [Rhodobacteraceae bacterium]|nr:aldehyde dehydrogenase family protein [Paracoccaceae bacterium]
MTDRENLFKSYMNAVGLNDTVENFINGKLTPGQGEKILLVDPFTGIKLTQYCDAGSNFTENACTASNSAQKIWMNDFSAAGRGQVMQRASLEISNNLENLAKLESIVSGKPIRDCRVEVSKVAEMFSYYGGWTDKLHGEVIPVPSGHLNYTIREPLGVIFQITPWNAPIFTAGWQIAPAIACGNGVVIKPSE